MVTEGWQETYVKNLRERAENAEQRVEELANALWGEWRFGHSETCSVYDCSGDDPTCGYRIPEVLEPFRYLKESVDG